MENIEYKEKEKSVPKYTSVLKSILLSLILLGNPQGFSINTNKEITSDYIDKQLNKNIIQESIRKTILELKTLDQLPMKIKYSHQNIQNVPDSIDINPKKITQPIKGIIIRLGERKWYIEPIMGDITDIQFEEKIVYINNKKVKNKILTLETSYLDKTYSDQKLSELCGELLRTKKGKGKKSGFIGTTVTEL